MKALLTALILTFSISSFAMDTPLLVKSSNSGYAPQTWMRSESCSLFTDRMQIVKSYGNVTIESEVKLNVTSGSLKDLVKKAFNEKLTEKDNYLCDGPSTVVREGIPPNVRMITDVLYSTGGCGNSTKERKGPFTAHLMDLMNQYCPITHKR